MVNSYSFSGMFSSITQTRAHQVRRNRRKIFGWEACTVAWACLSRRLAPLCQNQRPELGERNIHLDLANSLVPGTIRYPKFQWCIPWKSVRIVCWCLLFFRIPCLPGYPISGETDQQTGWLVTADSGRGELDEWISLGNHAEWRNCEW
jgi:hypothetical protein